LFGSFNVTSGGLKDIRFFICNSTNFQNWTHGKNAILYLSQAGTTYNWDFWVPQSGTWYIVFDNTFSTFSDKYVTIISGNGTGPVITISHPLPYSGDTISGTVLINASAETAQLSINSISIKIDGTSMTTKQSSSINYSWDTTSWSDGYHTITVTASDNLGNSNNKSITVDVLNPPSGWGGTTALLIELVSGGAGILFIVVIIAAVVSRRRESREGPPETVLKPTRKVMKPGEKEVIEMQPGFCPHCGAKTLPGATFCKNCGANLRQ
jgi:hypothetical protein